MKQSKRHRTKLISFIIILITVAILVLLSICLYRQPSLEVRFDAVIHWLAKLESAVADLDTHIEILICLFDFIEQPHAFFCLKSPKNLACLAL